MDQRDLKSESFNPAPRSPAMQPMVVPLSQLPDDPCQTPSQTPLAFALAGSPLITNPASSQGPAAVNPQTCLDSYSQLPLPGRGRTEGRLGVSFCFSRRGPRLEPSASVFSDVEEEEREKRDQMKERIKGIMEDIDREIGEVEERKHSESERLSSDSVVLDDLVPAPREATRASPISSLVPDNQSHDSLFLPSKTQVVVWGTALAHMDTKYTDRQTVGKQESQAIREEGRYVRVLGKDDSTCLRWPVNLLKFTKSRPHVCYSCNPLCMNSHQTKEPTENLQESRQNQLCAPSGEYIPHVPAILVPDARSCLRRQTTLELRAHTQEKAKRDLKAEQHIDGETEEQLFPKNKNLSSLKTRPEGGAHTLSVETCERTASHPFDPAHSDSSDTNSQGPRGSRLRGARGIRERAFIALSCKSESFIHCGTQGMCISPARCECGSETMCECATAPQTCVGVSEVLRKRRRASTKKHKLGKRMRGEKEKAAKKCQSARRKVRSVVSTVSTGRGRRGEVGGSWGKKERQRGAGMRRKRRVQRAGNSCPLGRSEAEPVSVSVVRKRKTHRSHITESKSQAEPCSVFSQLSRHTADRHTKGDRHAVTYPWGPHVSLHSSSPRCNSKLFWERGHHSNSRSLFNCCNPDNSCGRSPSRKRKLPHCDRKCVYHKVPSLRHREVWEETERGRKMEGRSGCRDRGPISEKEWRGESCPRGRRSRNRAGEWDQLARCSPSPRSWGGRKRHLSTEDVDWDGRSMDRWTWGSSDSGEDRGTHRSTPGSRTGADSRYSLGSVWRYTPEIRHSSSKRSSSSERWTSRQTYSPNIITRAGRCRSPRSCSPCSSTGISELSWESSKSSSCSGVTVGGLTVSSCRSSSGALELKIEPPREPKKQSAPTCSTSGHNCSSLSHSLSNRSSFSPLVPLVSTQHGDTSPSQLKEKNSQSDLGHGPSEDVAANVSGTTPGLSSNKTGSQKSPRMSLLPLIGKLPAIQRRARRIKGLPEKRQEKEGEDEEVARSSGADAAGAVSRSQIGPSQISTDKKQTGGETAPPISFTAEEMDKYRLLQEQAREHMQKVLEQTQESANTDRRPSYTHTAPADNCVTAEERYTPAPLCNASQAQTQSIHSDSMQTQAQHTLQAGLPLPHVTPQERFAQPMVLGVPNLPPLPPSRPHPGLRHIFVQHTALSMGPASSSSPTPSPSAAIHPHPAHLHHPVPPLHPSLAHHLHLSAFSVSSLFPSILLSHHPIHLLPQSPAFHGTPLPQLSPVALQPLHPQPFIDRAWPVRFQQKAL